MNSKIGTSIAKQKAWSRQQYGTQVTTATGTVLKMYTRSLEKKEREYLPEGIGNMADADLRVFEATPTDFTTLPLPGSTLSWHGISYTLLAARSEDNEIGGIIVTLLLYCFKTPAPDSATTETAGEASPGQRKEYWPAPSVL